MGLNLSVKGGNQDMIVLCNERLSHAEVINGPIRHPDCWQLIMVIRVRGAQVAGLKIRIWVIAHQSLCYLPIGFYLCKKVYGNDDVSP